MAIIKGLGIGFNVERGKQRTKLTKTTLGERETTKNQVKKGEMKSLCQL